MLRVEARPTEKVVIFHYKKKRFCEPYIFSTKSKNAVTFFNIKSLRSEGFDFGEISFEQIRRLNNTAYTNVAQLITELSTYSSASKI